MKKYCLVLLFLVLNAALFGFAAPYLISAASTELVLAGILTVAFALPANFYLLKLILKRGTTV